MKTPEPLVLSTADVEVVREAFNLCRIYAIALPDAIRMTYAVASYRARAEMAEAALARECEVSALLAEPWRTDLDPDARRAAAREVAQR